MKKFMTAVLALVLTLGMGVTVMADSVTKTVNVQTGINVSLDSVYDGDGNFVEAGVQLQQMSASGSVIDYAKDVASNYGVNMDLLAYIDVTITGAVTYPVKITFNVDGVKAGETIYVLHYSSDRGWETLAGTAGDGTVTATFRNLSPIAFVRPAASAASSAGYSPEYYEELKAMYNNNAAAVPEAAAAAAPVVSPKTTEDNSMAGFAFGAALCVAAVVFAGRKKRA